MTIGTRAVLVTGGGTGIGLAVAERLISAGGKVVVTGRRAEPLESLAHRFPRQAFAFRCDLSQPGECEGLISRAGNLVDGLDGFVHSAGVVSHQALGEIDDASLRAQLEVNLIAPLRLGEQCLALLPRGGAMVFVASTLAHRPVATSAAYSASKAGLLQVMRVLALTGAATGIRANAVTPGVVDTEMVKGRGAALAALHPLGRLGTAEEVAEAVVHLLGAGWTTGSELVVDGGLMLRE